MDALRSFSAFSLMDNLSESNKKKCDCKNDLNRQLASSIMKMMTKHIS